MRAAQRIIRAVEASASDDGFILDAAQHSALERMSALGAGLSPGVSRRGAPRGLYVYGEPGRGKSWLADAFYAALPIRRKTRVHFHGFFDELHRNVYSRMGERDAIGQAIDDVIGDSTFLFFDELHVHDSGDARLLNRLLERVFAQQITVLATSNYAPENLLPNPIWHHTIEPGIALIQAHMDAWPMLGTTDYRAANRDHSQGFASGVWSTAPSRAIAAPPHSLEVRGRSFAVNSVEGRKLTATFEQLCEAPTSTIEYLEWARDYTRWSITDIPQFDAADAQAQQRFINLVDVLVEADVPVDFYAAVELDDFLADASQRPDAFRMSSRLRLLQMAVATTLVGAEPK